jgi:hypothetical protein
MTREESIKDKKKAIAEACIALTGEMVKLVLLHAPTLWLVKEAKKLFITAVKKSA